MFDRHRLIAHTKDQVNISCHPIICRIDDEKIAQVQNAAVCQSKNQLKTQKTYSSIQF